MSEKLCNLIGGGGMKETIDLIYPVGRTIICDHNPQDDYTWQKWEQDFKDVFPLGAGDTYAAGSTGGEAQHTLTQAEMPSHAHAPYADGNASNPSFRLLMGNDSWFNADYGTSYFRVTGYNNKSYKGFEAQTSHVGGSEPHNNMPPYKAVKFWTRTA